LRRFRHCCTKEAEQRGVVEKRREEKRRKEKRREERGEKRVVRVDNYIKRDRE
jgi:hypothetical protein